MNTLYPEKKLLSKLWLTAKDQLVENPLLAPIEILVFIRLIVLNDDRPFLGSYLSLNYLRVLWGGICTGNSGIRWGCAQPARPSSAARAQARAAAGAEIPLPKDG